MSRQYQSGGITVRQLAEDPLSESNKKKCWLEKQVVVQQIIINDYYYY